MVVDGVGVESAACLGDVDQISGRQVAEYGGDELGGEGNQAGLWRGVCAELARAKAELNT